MKDKIIQIAVDSSDDGTDLIGLGESGAIYVYEWGMKYWRFLSESPEKGENG